MRFTDDFLQEVTLRNDIIDIMGQSIKLQSAGVGKFKALCPFHRDTKTPSLSISSDKQVWHCFGCGAGGGVIQFVMDQEGLDFQEAVRLLAEKAGLDLPEETGEEYVKNDIKKILFEINLECAKYYRDELAKCKKAVKYAEERGINPAVIKKFGIGYAPSNLEILDILEKKGYSKQQLNLAGILGKSDDGRDYLRFRDRLMFPIIDLRKNVIAFGGRAFGDDMPKYLNTSNTPIFNKSYNLYALNIAKNSPSQNLILAEGYMDVIALHQAGFDTAVATLGTALTEQQCKLIRRFRQEVVLCYDSDEAGQKATRRSIDLLMREGIKARVLIQPDCKDPDEYIQVHGAAAFGEMVKNAPIAIEHLYEELIAKFDLKTSEGKIGFARNLALELAKIESEIELEIYGRKCADMAGIAFETILAEIGKAKKRAIVGARLGAPETVGTAIGRPKNAEQELIKLMTQDKTVLDIAREKLKAEDFDGELWQDLAGDLFDGKNFEEINSNPKYVENMKKIAELVLSDEQIGDIKLAANELVDKVKANSKKRRLDEAAKSGDLKLVKEIMDE